MLNKFPNIFFHYSQSLPTFYITRNVSDRFDFCCYINYMCELRNFNKSTKWDISGAWRTHTFHLLFDFSVRVCKRQTTQFYDTREGGWARKEWKVSTQFKNKELIWRNVSVWFPFVKLTIGIFISHRLSNIFLFDEHRGGNFPTTSMCLSHWSIFIRRNSSMPAISRCEEEKRKIVYIIPTPQQWMRDWERMKDDLVTSSFVRWKMKAQHAKEAWQKWKLKSFSRLILLFWLDNYFPPVAILCLINSKRSKQWIACVRTWESEKSNK